MSHAGPFFVVFVAELKGKYTREKPYLELIVNGITFNPWQIFNLCNVRLLQLLVQTNDIKHNSNITWDNILYHTL